MRKSGHEARGPLQRQIALRREEFRQALVAEWRQRLLRPTAGLATVEAIRPVLDDWLGRRHGSLSFRVTQVLSGHGCFGKYLCRIDREPDARTNHVEERVEADLSQTTPELAA
ncbi:uncharacterized protein LOC134201038 [Bombyx mori]|uniref:uncharacterized protein LOC134201038 n=1 Tax=Bombyx mori TaxID=7091 RepID=UPI002ED4CD1E